MDARELVFVAGEGGDAREATLVLIFDEDNGMLQRVWLPPPPLAREAAERAADAPGVLEHCSFHVLERLGKLWKVARRVAATVFMYSYVCVVIAGQFLYVLLELTLWALWGMLVLASVPFQVAYFFGKELWRRARRVIPSSPLTDAQLQSMLDEMRSGPPPLSNAMLMLMLKDFRKEAPRWGWGVANGCTRAEVDRMLVLLRNEIYRSARLVRFVPSPLPPPRPPSPPPRPPSPPPDPGVSHANGRSGAPQREYPYQTEPAQRKHQWYGTTTHKPSKKGRRQPAPDQSNRDERIQAAQERRKACLAAKEAKKMEDDARRENMKRALEVGRSINREERRPWRAGAPVPPPRSSLTGISKHEPTHCTLADFSPADVAPRGDRDGDDASSVAETVDTTNVPTPHTLHSEAQCAKRGHEADDVRRSLKHGAVIPGHCEEEYVHLPSRAGDPKVVTVNTDNGFVIKTVI